MKKENIFTTATQKRQIQIARWFIESVYEANHQSIFIEILQLIKTGKSQEAYKKFHKFIRSRIEIEEQFVYYVIWDNMQTFGHHRTLSLLFNLTISLLDKKISVGKVKPTKTSKTTLQEFSKEITQKKRYGYNKEGKKRNAFVEISIINNRIQYRLKDVETKQYLKHSDSFNKEVEELKK